MRLNVLSYGGGIQSTALLVLAKRRIVEIDVAIFIELDTENPATVRYVRDISEPFCKDVGIKFVRVNVSLEKMIIENPSFPPVPFRSTRDELFGRRQCTNHGKIRPFRRSLRSLMRERNAKHANVMLGISVDEIERARDSDVRYITNIYPLIDLSLDRAACRNIIAAELPVPPKSSCWFCPYATGIFQRQILREHPHLIRKAAELQDLIDAARQSAGADMLRVIRCDLSQQDMFDYGCGGMCHT